MNESKNSLSTKHFSHIYIEEAAYSYPLCTDIINKFPYAEVIRIAHYKDVFNRANQNFIRQKESGTLILAVNNGELIYKGARVCQNFGNDNFYYCSNIMNCFYDCEYCYLQGMYPSGYMVVFVNYEDYFTKIQDLLKTQSMYICISYDTDLLTTEAITGLTEKWIDFVNKNPNLTIEIRTKSAFDVTRFNNCSERVIFAWTLSPDYVASNYEHHTPALSARLNAVNKAITSGFSVRLCFDPMINIPNYKAIYEEFFSTVFNSMDYKKIYDASLGLFRISSSYMKAMRKKRFCAITAYPYETVDGICSYDEKKSDEMLNFARSEISKYIPAEKIFIS